MTVTKIVVTGVALVLLDGLILWWILAYCTEVYGRFNTADEGFSRGVDNLLAGHYTVTIPKWDGFQYPTPDILDIPTYLSLVKTGSIRDGDGYGHPVKGDKLDSRWLVVPSQKARCIPVDATAVAWYTR